jgi:hypothetical protein
MQSKMKTRTLGLGVTAVVLALTVGSAQAATIDLLDSDSYKQTSAQVTHTIPVSASGTIKKLILSTHKESGATLLSVKYNDVSMTMIPGTQTGDTRVRGIWELDNPALTSGNIVVTFDGGSQLGLAFAALGSSDGNDVAVGSVNATAGTSIELDVPNDDSFVFVAGGGNGGSRNMAVQAPLTRLTIDRMNSMAADAGYQENVDSSGSPYTYSINTTASTPKMTAASFYVVPEPASLATGLVGMLLIVGCRRRQTD